MSATTGVGKIRRPCSSCPWRVDTPRDYWDPQHFVDIYRNCQDDSMHIMLCHKSSALPPEDRKELPCQGWIRVMGFQAIEVRLLSMRNAITDEEIKDRGGPKLFKTFEAMLRANKIPIPKRSQWVPVKRVKNRAR